MSHPDDGLDEIEQEIEGYQAGKHPFQGSFSRKFSFPAVPYGHRDRRGFMRNLQKEISDIQYLFYDAVKVNITLYFDQTVLEYSPDRADLDNYAKLICDCIKGPDGILIDDTQIQALYISYIDTELSPYFEIAIEGWPDQYTEKPIGLYEMPDKLFYPFPEDPSAWDEEGMIETVRERKRTMLSAFHAITKRNYQLRHLSRQEGCSPLDAYYIVAPFKPMLRGFHKTRIVESGFNYYELEQWMADIGIDQSITEPYIIERKDEERRSHLREYIRHRKNTFRQRSRKQKD